MTITPKDVLTCNQRWTEILEEIFSEPLEPGRRAERIAAGLRTIAPLASAPTATVAVCVLGDALASHIAVVDAEGRSRPDWATLLNPIEILPDNSLNVALPAAIDLPSHMLVVERFSASDQMPGLLGLAVPRDAMAGNSLWKDQLAGWAAQLALRLALEAEQAERKELLGKLIEQAKLADFEESARSVSHEFNNFLNVLLLQIAVLEQELPQEYRDQLADIRKQARNVTGVIKQLQRFRQHCQSVLRAVDLNRVLCDVLETMQSRSRAGRNNHERTSSSAVRAGERVEQLPRLELAPDLPPVLAVDMELREFSRLLLSDLVELQREEGVATVVRTSAEGPVVLLHVEPLVEPSAGLNSTSANWKSRLDWQKYGVMVKRLHGKLHPCAAEGTGLSLELLAFPEPREDRLPNGPRPPMFVDRAHPSGTMSSS